MSPWSMFGQVDPDGGEQPNYLTLEKRAELEAAGRLRTEYDEPRVRYFAGRVRQGDRIEPVEVDCRCGHGMVYPDPVIVDGWHRFAGTVMAGAERMKISFSGRVDLLRYLQGRRKTRPD